MPYTICYLYCSVTNHRRYENGAVERLVWLLCYLQLSRCMTGLDVCSVVKSFRCCSIIRSHSDIWSLSSMASVHVPQLPLNQVGIVHRPCDKQKVYESLVFSENARHLM